MTDNPSNYPSGQEPEQLKTRPGIQAEMKQQPATKHPGHTGSGKLKDKVAIVTGGDSGIGRAIAVAFATEGADIAVVYLNEDADAGETARLVQETGRKCKLYKGDIGEEKFCKEVVDQTVAEFGKLNILVNNAAEQHPQASLTDITEEQLERTFRTNIFSMFFLTKAALPNLQAGDTVINNASITAYKGNPELLDYSSTKGAIVSFTRSLAMSVAEDGIRVNAVAPGPIWTPLIPSTFDKEKVEGFGTDTPMKRAGQPEEVAMAFVFLASDDSSYISGQTIHVNGGTVVNS